MRRAALLTVTLLHVAAITAGAFVLSSGLTLLMRNLALRIGAVALPRNDRWHRTQIPLLGGVAIAGATSLASITAGVGDPEIWYLLGAGLILFAVGLADDLRPLRPQSKLVAQILVAAMLVALGLQLRLTGYPMLDVFVTLFWIVGITNAFNLLDNMDGLAAGVAAIAVGFRLAFLVSDGNMEEAAFAGSLLGAFLGFLMFNFNPASIFMGDAGSLFTGVMVSGMSLVGGWPYSRGVVSVLLLPVLVLLVPIFDTALVSIARTLAGRSISQGGRDHTSHRLVALGLSEREAVLVLYGVSIGSGVIALLSYRYGLSYAVVLVALLALGMMLFGVYLGRLRVYPEELPLADGARFVKLVTDFPYKRQMATVLIDLLLIATAYYSAYLLRFEDTFTVEQERLIASMPIVIACQLLTFALFRTYRGLWRYTSLGDLIRLVQAATVGTAAAALALLFVSRFAGYSRTVFVLDWLLLIVLVGGTRLAFRAFGEYLRPSDEASRRVLIYGAGEGGVMLLRELRHNPLLRSTPVGFVDDDRGKQRTRVQDVPVLGGFDDLPRLVEEMRIDQVIVSSRKVSPDRLLETRKACEPLGASVVKLSIRLE